MSKIFFISDTHFHHKNILKYEPMRARMLAQYLIKKGWCMSEDNLVQYINEIVDAADERLEPILDAHDNMLIDAWNSVVGPDDIVWHVGDVFFKNKNKALQIGRKLNGHKRLIRGNHDKCFTDEFFCKAGFEFITQYPIILKDWFILSHKPSNFISENSPYFYIYGHVHSSETYATHTEHSQCVCCERSNFIPIQIEEFDAVE